MWRTLLVLVLGFLGVSPLEDLYYWKLIDYDFPDQSTREAWLRSGQFQPINTLLLDADYTFTDPKDRVFATTPPFRTGSPVTLSTVVTNKQGRVFLKPYPSWEENTREDCKGLTSVLRIQTTDCGHLWVLDSGRVDILGSYLQKCPPKLRVYDLTNDKIYWEYQIPYSNLNNSLLGTLEVVGNCTHPFVYLADIVGHAIIVVNTVRRLSWRVENELTANDPSASHFNLEGQSFDLMDGVISFAVSRNTLYFHSLASFKENLIPTWILNDPYKFVGPNVGYQYFRTSSGQRPGQSGPAVIVDNGSVMFFSVLTENALYCWRVGSPYERQNLHLVYRDDVKFQFASGLKVVRDRSGQEWIMATTSRFQNYINKVVNPQEVNYRILTFKVSTLLNRCWDNSLGHQLPLDTLKLKQNS